MHGESGKKVGEGVDFVDYFTAGVADLHQEGRRPGHQGLGPVRQDGRGAAGHASPQDLAKAEAKKCPERQEALRRGVRATTSRPRPALRAGGAAPASSDFPVAADAVKTSGGGKDFELVGEQVEAAPYGIAVAKNDAQLRDALKAALDAIIANGEYGKILDKWGVAEGAVEEAVINGGK
ncbi:Secreted protein OS=Streptomyces glaucescens OX=1907 GN=SGLAU_22680 PE=4 SV=1 [Streptomyces glaucescens]